MLAFDLESGPREGILESKFAPVYKQPDYKPFEPEKIKRLKSDDDESFRAKYLEAEEAHQLKRAKELQDSLADFEQAKEKFLDEACLSPHTGRILAIGLYNGADFKCLEGDEAEMLRTFWLQVQACIKRQEQMVGHNILNFDLPFLVNRSKILGVRVPGAVVVKSGKFLNWCQSFIDTAQEWLLGRYARDCRWSLDACCYAFGLEGKSVDGVEGKGWWRHYSANRELALQYLENDCIQSYRLAERLVSSNI